MISETGNDDTKTKTDPDKDAKDPKEDAFVKLVKDRDNLLDQVMVKQQEVAEAQKDAKNAKDEYSEYLTAYPKYDELEEGDDGYNEFQKKKKDFTKTAGTLDVKQAEFTTLKKNLGLVYNNLTQEEIKSAQNSNDVTDTSSQASSNKSHNAYAPTKPKMGGLIDTYQGPEAWTGGKPTSDWKKLDSSSKKTPLPTQIRSNNSKAAISMLKRTEGLLSDEKLKFQHGDDLDYFCLRIDNHFEKHGLDTIAYRFDNQTQLMICLLYTSPSPRD